MGRDVRITIRCWGDPESMGPALEAVASRVGATLLEASGTLPRATVVLRVDDDRPDELLAIDFAFALRDLADGDRRLHAAAVRLADAEHRR